MSSGKLDSWLATIVLLEQEMHNPKFEGKTVQQLRDELTATTARTWSSAALRGSQ